jgi:hypothetical protein
VLRTMQVAPDAGERLAREISAEGALIQEFEKKITATWDGDYLTDISAEPSRGSD